MDFQSRYAFNPKTDLLGKGGFSKVYKANDTLLDRTVALKFFTGNGFEKYQVLNEIKKVIRFEHPNLCKYYDVAVINTTNIVGEAETIEVGIMEYLDAGDLKKYLQANPQHIDKLLIDVLKGLSYLHRKGIVHRDLKPQNILVKMEDDEPVAKITDFGISKLLGADDSSASALIGTIEYMAPEQFNPKRYGMGGRITTNLDLWSFGLLVYEVIEQKPLFGSRSKGVSAEQIMTNILNDSYQTKTRSLPSKYRAIVDRCLIKDAAQRVQVAHDLIPMFSEEGIPSSIKPLLDVPAVDDDGPSGEVESDPDTMLLSVKADASEKESPPPVGSTETIIQNKEISGDVTRVLQNYPDEEDAETKVIRPKENSPKPVPIEAAITNERGNEQGDAGLDTNLQNRQTIFEKENIDREEGRNRRKLALYLIVPLLLIVGLILFRNSNRSGKDLTAQNSKPPDTTKVVSEAPKHPNENLNMVKIAGGQFMMGAENGNDPGINPAHTVTVSDFSLSKYEVTVDEFRQFINATRYITTAEEVGSSPIYHNGGWETGANVNWRCDASGKALDTLVKNIPVVHVSWLDASRYCKWLSDTTHRHFRLPTDAEWEYAAKGGDATKKYKYSGSDDLDKVAWFKGNSGSRVHPVGQKQPNDLNIYDMSGNVLEWCNDWYVSDYYLTSPLKDPTGPASGKDRVVRGGSWYISDLYWFYNSYRDGFGPKTTGGQIGFRICETN